MAISHRAVRGAFLGAAMVSLLVLGTTGCGGADDEAAKGPDVAVAGTELCGGDAVSADAAKSLKVITGVSRFEGSGMEGTVADAARKLGEASVSSSTGDGDVCRVYAPDDELRITWQLSGSAPADDPASKFTVLKMGERALTATDGAYLRFACRSGKLPGSEPAHIDIGVERGGMPTDPEGAPDALKDAYATVAHSFSLAMAKELGCEDNAGLPETPDLTPK
ncbi:hypothetical protein ACIRD6_15475 [Streptomyces sp. NPDC102473]|uniref:hypothetical protein n=1 Tax=Streptomyces sp. NPDC102473 TaxID=3366180 RepID=UPI003817225D